ncbi:MAG: ATP-binding protein [Bacteroidales bacterium]
MNTKFEILAKYNFWNNQTIPLGFVRTNYTEKIYLYGKESRLVKVLVGQRRVGKSYILRQLASKLIDNGVPRENILFINCELAAFSFIRTAADLDDLVNLYKEELHPRGRIYLFIDEIQNIEGWEQIVNSYSQDYVENYDLFISGSNSRMLSGELATYLSGRYVTFEVYPFSYDEYCAMIGKELNKSSYMDYIQSGGLPELFVLPEQESKINYISAIKDTVLLRDIIQRHNIKDSRLLEDIFVYLINNASNLLSVRNITNYFKSVGRKTSYDTVSTYIGYIENTYLIHRVERYNIRGKDTIAGNCKYYANDLSFNNYLYQGFGYGIGYQLENIVYLELARKGYDIYVGSIKEKEIDFVAIKGDKTLYIQVAYILVDIQTIEREYSALMAIDDHYEKMVVSLDDLAFPAKEGIKHIQAWNLSKVI